MGPGRSLHDRSGRRDELRHRAGVTGIDSRAGLGNVGVATRANHDPAGSRLPGQDDRPRYVAPGSRATTPPGRADSSAACRSPPPGTAIVRPDGSTAVVSTTAAGG